jgi:predicted aldo/keto reductase-like oxidoreductase
MGLHTELVKLRDEGMVRFIGLTGHASFELMHRLIATGGFDQLLIAYGYFHKGMVNLLSNVDQEWRNLCIAKAHELGMGIVAMKVMGGWVYGHAAGRVVPGYDQGALGRLPGAAIRWVLSDPRISILNIGVCLPSDIDDNIATLVGDTTLTNDDRLLLADFSGRAYESPDLQNVLERVPGTPSVAAIYSAATAEERAWHPLWPPQLSSRWNGPEAIMTWSPLLDAVAVPESCR